MKKWFLLCIFFSSLLQAEDKGSLSLAVGVNNFLRHNYITGEARIEYKPSIHYQLFYPILGGLFTFKGATYLYAGFGIDVTTKRIYFFPSFAVGWYQKGHGRDLGYPLEFRTSVELGFKIFSSSRLGGYVYHISNASIGKRNPGMEGVGLVYTYGF
ncbi:MAG: acyloxyacyl hydrolase [Chlamydiota bacterium]